MIQDLCLDTKTTSNVTNIPANSEKTELLSSRSHLWSLQFLPFEEIPGSFTVIYKIGEYFTCLRTTRNQPEFTQRQTLSANMIPPDQGGAIWGVSYTDATNIICGLTHYKSQGCKMVHSTLPAALHWSSNNIWWNWRCEYNIHIWKSNIMYHRTFRIGKTLFPAPQPT